MVLPIVAYGTPVLRQKAEEIDLSDPEWQSFIDDMFETMYNASGVGLAAPQVDEAVRIFVIDPAPFAEWDNVPEAEKEALRQAKMAFINPVKISEEGEAWSFDEGCLSIPGIIEKVKRPSRITLEYYDRHGRKHRQTFDGLIARVIQHEYDHLEGILFTDHLSAIKKKMLAKKLDKIARGQVQTDYPMKFPKRK